MGIFGTGLQRICAVAAASTAAEMAKLVRVGLKQTSTFELRLDWLSSDAERARFLRWLRIGRFRKAIFLATCRRREGGGKFAGGVDRELYWLVQAREAGCQWCDLEVETLHKLPGRSVSGYPVPPRVLLSLHDFERTPDLPRTMNPPAKAGVDAMKLAAKGGSIQDSVRLLRLARNSKNFVAAPMGEFGLPARILALREGSALAYAPVATATAPGQVSLDDLKYLYRAHELTLRTRVYGVIGEPVSHSLSPLLHNTGFIERHVDAVYLPFLVHDLRDFLAVVPEFGVRGFSVTHPHKQAILKYLKECDPLAAEIGAVNTVVVRRDGSLVGSNTDYLGVLRALEKKLRIKGSRVLIFGAGGASRAAAFALARAGAAIAICARREKAARELARAFGGEVVPRAALRSEFFDAILNTTPVGMYPHDGVSPLALGELRCRLVMDMINRPQKTQLLKLAASKGIATVPGVEMLLAQGYAQWELWTGKSAPEPAIRRAVLVALRRAENSTQRR
ncbi:MAG TPA: shikimate dehydrogenase [Candidatus Acidoferrum sp.]|nr:shikimate dehydrogenase [Candidatus Acidoferrum sp.]